MRRREWKRNKKSKFLFDNLNQNCSAYAEQDLAIVKMRTMMEEDTQNKHKAMTTAMKDYNAQLAL